MNSATEALDSKTAANKRVRNNIDSNFQDVGYQPYGGPYGMYQPPPPPPAHIMDPTLAFNGLNVTDPRFAAKYGNPYLRAPVPPDMPPNNMGSPQMNPRNYSFATLNRGYQQAPSSPNMQGFSTSKYV